MNLYNTKERCVGRFQEVFPLWKSRLQSRYNPTYYVTFTYKSKQSHTKCIRFSEHYNSMNEYKVELSLQ